MSRTSKENQRTKYRSQGISASIQGREVRSKNSQDQYVVFEREAREFLNYFTLSCLNYVTEEYHSHRRLIDTARKTHSKKINTRTQVRKSKNSWNRETFRRHEPYSLPCPVRTCLKRSCDEFAPPRTRYIRCSRVVRRNMQREHLVSFRLPCPWPRSSLHPHHLVRNPESG